MGRSQEATGPQLADMEKIRQLKARYFRLIDLKRWDELRGLFASDIACDYRGAGTDPVTGFNAVPGATPGATEDVLRGVDEVVGALESGLSSIATVHSGHSPEITLNGPDSASGIWGMTDIMRFPDSAPYAGLRGFGHYHETYVREPDGWKLKTLKLTRLLVEVVPHST